ncbi:hypothetical protein BKA65DRAFT_58599 [Rhexocercosporidium sp. MPI-PUGE-AT-0058]|nr:hypothetical protein BKA65DRAFT_58599 [Rhexocercosporidium sp. MPI-PUGE-AT-0058]
MLSALSLLFVSIGVMLLVRRYGGVVCARSFWLSGTCSCTYTNKLISWPWTWLSLAGCFVSVHMPFSYSALYHVHVVGYLDGEIAEQLGVEGQELERGMVGKLDGWLDASDGGDTTLPSCSDGSVESPSSSLTHA